MENIRQQQEEKGRPFLAFGIASCLLESLVYKDIEQYGLIRLTDCRTENSTTNRENIKLSINHDYKAEAADVQVGKVVERVCSTDPVQYAGEDPRKCGERTKAATLYHLQRKLFGRDMATYPCNLEELSKIRQGECR